ncbi:MAG: hypothetical protein K2X35_03940 [Bryobacteraceae bacterium]|nr:hypothetical protein [Bryobacteraceae bacterium]
MTLPDHLQKRILAIREPLPSAAREPVHVVYGGAHLYAPGSAAKLGRIALKTLELFGEFPELAPVRDQVMEKLRREPVEDQRIDFEDGYGYRSAAEEDGHAIAAARAVADSRDTLPPFCGIRIKPLTAASCARAARTLELFLTHLGDPPPNFVVTLPKVTVPEQVEALLALLPGQMRIEVMIETPQSLGCLNEIAAAGAGRIAAAHFGAYDYTAALGISAADQDMLHPACDLARGRMQAALVPLGIRVSDGATNVLPAGTDGEAVHEAWRIHTRHIRHSLRNGFYQSWDLHPAQLVSRYAAVYGYFRGSLPQASERLRNFLDRAAQATRSGQVFDDKATGEGLLNFFRRALNCGAIEESELPGISRAGLHGDLFGAGA